MDAQERARLLLDKHFQHDPVAGYIPMHYSQLERDLPEYIRQAELEATKITPEMIEAAVAEARRLQAKYLAVDLTEEELRMLVTGALKAALGVE